MEYTIREMNTDDKCEILSMMREFYASDLVFTNGSEEIFETDFNFIRLCVGAYVPVVRDFAKQGITHTAAHNKRFIAVCRKHI